MENILWKFPTRIIYKMILKFIRYKRNMILAAWIGVQNEHNN